MTSPPGSRPQLSECVSLGLMAGLGLCVLALVGILIFFVFKLAGVRTEPVVAREMLLGLPLIFASYLAAGLICGIGYWAIRPLHRWVVGWLLTGTLMALAVYGTIGLTGNFAYSVLGVNLLGLESPEEGWAFFGKFLLFVAGIGFFLWGPLLWWQFGRDDPD